MATTAKKPRMAVRCKTVWRQKAMAALAERGASDAECKALDRALHTHIVSSAPGSAEHQRLYEAHVEKLLTYWSVIKQQVAAGRLTLTAAAVLDEEFLDPAVWPCVSKMSEKARLAAYGLQYALSSNIKCGKCGGDTVHKEAQMRSGDEGSSFMVFCPKCDYSFVVS